MSLSLIAGLGNPGETYRGTRHNVGFILVDALAGRAGAAWRRENRFEAEVARWERAGRTLWLVKPQTYVNESGRALGALGRYYQIPAEEMAVICDEVQIPVGRLKISIGGGAGGHHGLESLLQHVGEGFVRCRVGVGPKEPAVMDLKDFVLGKLKPEEQTLLAEKMEEWLGGLQLLIDSGPASAMNKLNQRLNINEGRERDKLPRDVHPEHPGL